MLVALGVLGASVLFVGCYDVATPSDSTYVVRINRVNGETCFISFGDLMWDKPWSCKK